MMSIGESVSTDCMMGTATYAALQSYRCRQGNGEFRAHSGPSPEIPE